MDKRSLLILGGLSAWLLCVVVWWSCIDYPLPGESVYEQLLKSFGALASDPLQAIRGGRGPYLTVLLATVAVALALKTIDYIFKLDISPFGTNWQFVAYVAAAYIFVFALEAGATKYGWYCYFCLYEPYKSLYGGANANWGGSPFDAFTHVPAGMCFAAFLLLFRLTEWLGIPYRMKPIIVLVISLIGAFGYEALAPEQSIAYWNAILDIMHHELGSFVSVVVNIYLVPHRLEFHLAPSR